MIGEIASFILVVALIVMLCRWYDEAARTKWGSKELPLWVGSIAKFMLWLAVVAALIDTEIGPIFLIMSLVWILAGRRRNRGGPIDDWDGGRFSDNNGGGY